MPKTQVTASKRGEDSGFSESATLLAKLGKHTTGKGCLYIKKLADVDQHVLETLVVKSLAAKNAHTSKK
jgi:predicted lactoylglutathione lyase